MSNIFNKYLWKKKFDISQFTGEDIHSVTLREPNTQEFKQLCKIQKKLGEASDNKTDEMQAAEEILDVVDTFCEICSTLIVDHDFFDEGDTTKKASSKDVADFIRAKIPLAKYILGEYLTSVPLGQTNGKK